MLGTLYEIPNPAVGKEDKTMRTTKLQRGPSYGYFAIGYFLAIIILSISLGIAIAVFLWKPIGIAIMCFGLYTLLTYLISNFLADQENLITYPE
ncbi:MAG: hypothetical protein AOA65_2173 [Candidatus Bathyarchaeota archaeon BA1]|nr:MAG: hypothetical protein AOA65_2173 [Candidatus Bathyarchaeota archaeon BA1]